MKKTFAILSAVFLSGALLVPSLQGQDIRTRMKQRIPQIISLKKSGCIGENEKGFLEAAPGSGKTVPAETEKLIKAENADRAAVYSFIAKKENVSAETVGAMRASKLAKLAKPGEYIRKDGKWVKK